MERCQAPSSWRVASLLPSLYRTNPEAKHSSSEGVFLSENAYRLANLLHEGFYRTCTGPISVWKKERKNPAKEMHAHAQLYCFFFGLVCFKGLLANHPLPSVHWGGSGVPGSVFNTHPQGFTLDRFTPTDGAGAKYDCHRDQYAGLQSHYIQLDANTAMPRFEGWSINVTGGISPHRQSAQRVSFKTRSFTTTAPPPTSANLPAAQDTDATDRWVGSPNGFLTKQDSVCRRWFSVGTIYQEQFLRGGHPPAPSHTGGFYFWRLGSCECACVRAGDRVSVQENGGGYYIRLKLTSHIFQPALAIGQYDTNELR